VNGLETANAITNGQGAGSASDDERNLTTPAGIVADGSPVLSIGDLQIPLAGFDAAGGVWALTNLLLALLGLITAAMALLRLVNGRARGSERRIRFTLAAAAAGLATAVLFPALEDTSLLMVLFNERTPLMAVLAGLGILSLVLGHKRNFVKPRVAKPR
jgi:hypothetical protein